ncbi:biotin carboxylase N-terminal domain-containing protein, partial [Pseudomonas sp. GG8]
MGRERGPGHVARPSAATGPPPARLDRIPTRASEATRVQAHRGGQPRRAGGPTDPGGAESRTRSTATASGSSLCTPRPSGGPGSCGRPTRPSCCTGRGRPARTSTTARAGDELGRALQASRADAAWVGWGFVAEDPAFAELCASLGVVFV